MWHFLDLWNQWDIQILVVLSFTLQMLLHLFGDMRRRSSSSALSILLWLVYLLADSAATYTLGHMVSPSSLLNKQSGRQHLVAFWAPFLLLHLGGQDTITAYALEDNELWLRHLLSLGVQGFGAAYILYKYIAGASRLLTSASVLVFVVGAVKYGERIWALICASMSRTPGSLQRHRSRSDHDNAYNEDAAYKYIVDAALYTWSHSTALFVTPSISSEWISPRDYLSNTVAPNGFQVYRKYVQWFQPQLLQVISQVTDMQLSLMYDLLYTKSGVIHTWYGLILRAFSSFAIISALVLFIISSSSRDHYNRADVAVTYVLLIGACVLEITSVFRVIGSTWTYAWLGWSSVLYLRMLLGRLLSLSLLRRHRHDTAPSSSSSLGSSCRASIGQYNLISMSTPRLGILGVVGGKIAKLIWLENWWNKTHYSTLVPTPPCVVQLIYREIIRRAALNQDELERLDANIRSGRWTRGHDEIQRHCNRVFRGGLMHFIFVCHMTTDIFLHCCDQDEMVTTAGDLPQVAMVLSNYMMFLLRVHQDILPTAQRTGSWSSSRYNDICNKLLPWVFESSKVEIKHEPGHRPQDILLNMKDELHPELVDVSEFATQLLLSEISLRPKFKFLVDLWVDTLLYVDDGITAKFHAKQLSYGGEFVTFVSVLTTHVGLLKAAYGPEDVIAIEQNSTEITEEPQSIDV